MTMPSNKWEEALDRILQEHGAEDGEFTHSLKTALTNAVREHVIGEDENFVKVNKKYLTRAERTKVTRNVLRAEQRANLLKAIGDPPM